MENKKARRIAPAGSFVVYPQLTPADPDCLEQPLFYVVEERATGEQRIFSLRGINRRTTFDQKTNEMLDSLHAPD